MLTKEQEQERSLAIKKYVDKRVKEFKKELQKLVTDHDYPFINGILENALLEMRINIRDGHHMYTSSEEGEFICWIQRYYNPRHFWPKKNPYLLTPSQNKPNSPS